MAFEWKTLVGGLAPTLGAALGGPLAGMAVKVLSDKLLGKPGASETEISAALSHGLTGDQVVALKHAEQVFAAEMREKDIDVIKLNQATQLAHVADTADARKAFAGKDKVFILGACILLTFAILMFSVLSGCFALMTGYYHVDPNMMAICAGMIGTAVGYVAANAQQVVSFFFGSSKGSEDSGNRLGQALTETIKAAGSSAPAHGP